LVIEVSCKYFLSSANVCTAINNYLTSFGMYIRRGDSFHFDLEATLLSAETTKFLMRNGHRQLVTAASPQYTQQLNGKVERIAGIIKKTADCMFSRLPSMSHPLPSLRQGASCTARL
jgi:hypothetical protein